MDRNALIMASLRISMLLLVYSTFGHTEPKHQNFFLTVSTTFHHDIFHMEYAPC